MTQPPPDIAMTGTPSQIEWAEQIKPRVSAEFDRVAQAFHQVAGAQRNPDRIETLAIIAILEEKRKEVMQHLAAGYFIRDWRELSDQVRRLIAGDPRYQAILTLRESRHKMPEQRSTHAIS